MHEVPVNSLFIGCFSDMYDKNLQLLDICRKGIWAEFDFSLEGYIISIDTLFELLSHNNELYFDDDMKLLMKEIVRNESEIVLTLEKRVIQLNSEMDSLFRGDNFMKLYRH